VADAACGGVPVAGTRDKALPPATCHLVPVFRFRFLRGLSFTHSLIYAALLYVAFLAGKPEPATFVLGTAHGVLWIVMSALCIGAARRRVIPFWLAVVVAVIGGLGPFAGTIGFVVADRRRQRTAT
jgi:hypothetical protein